MGCWNAVQKWLAVAAWVINQCLTPQPTWSYGLVNSHTNSFANLKISTTFLENVGE